MVATHPLTEVSAGTLYGEYSHPLNRKLNHEGVALVSETLSRQLNAVNYPLQNLNEAHILECGGTGRDALAWINLGAKSVTHVDLSEDNIARLRVYAEKNGIINLTAIHGDLLAIELPDNHFDIVRSRGVVHHLAIPALGLARYTSWAKLGGLVHFNAYRSGTFYYYGIKLLRKLVSLEDLKCMSETLSKLNIAADRAGILLDDFFVPYMHTASPSVVKDDLQKLGVEELWPNRSWDDLNHDIRYPDMPEKIEHIEFWARKTQRLFDTPEAVTPTLGYQEGIDDIALAGNVAASAHSLEAFKQFREFAKQIDPQRRLEALVDIYLAHHFDISIKVMPAQERHEHLANAFLKQIV